VSAKIFLGRQRTADSLKTAQTFTVLSQVLFGNCSGIVLLVSIPLPVLGFVPVQLWKSIAGGEIF
jgi:hypothetical protein